MSIIATVKIAKTHAQAFLKLSEMVLFFVPCFWLVTVPARSEQDSPQQFWLNQAKRKSIPNLPSLASIPVRTKVQAAAVLKPLPRSVPDGLDQSVNVLAVLGDAMADDLARGLQENFANRGDIFIVSKSVSGSFLVGGKSPALDTNEQNSANKSSDDFAEIAKQIANGHERISIALISLGLRDLGFVPKDDASNDNTRFSDSWQVRYKDKVDAVMTAFNQHKIPVIWVGLPQGLDDTQLALVKQLNALTEERVDQFGGHFIDARALFANDEARVDVFGTGFDGRRAKLWHEDRLILSRAGARKFALLTEHDIRQALINVPTLDFAALPPEIDAPKGDINALFRKDDGMGHDIAKLEEKATGVSKNSDLQELVPEPRLHFDTITLSAVQTAPMPLNLSQAAADKVLLHPSFSQNAFGQKVKNSAESIAPDSALKEDVASVLMSGKPFTPRFGRLDETSLVKP